MVRKKAAREPRRATKLTLTKRTVRDLTTRRDAAGAVRGGLRRACMSCNDSCTSN
jgi:hypothetical protein